MTISDQDFHGKPAEDATGKKAFESIGKDLKAYGESVRLPAVDSTTAIRATLRISGELLRLEEELVPYFNADLSQKIHVAVQSLPRICHAAHYVLAQFEHNDPKRLLSTLIPKGFDLRQLGFHWTTVLVGLNQVEEKRLAKLKEGRGHLDLGRDLQNLAELLQPHWDRLSMMQDLQADETLRLKEEDIEGMAQLGTQIVAALDVIEETRPWYRELVSVMRLLEDRYETVYLAWLYHNRRNKQPDPPSFYALGRAVSHSTGLGEVEEPTTEHEEPTSGTTEPTETGG